MGTGNDGLPLSNALCQYLVTNPGVDGEAAYCMPGKEGKGERCVFRVTKDGYYFIYMGHHKENHSPVWEYAHRIVCFAFNGPPLDGHEAGHLCGCANCLAPTHLVSVTKAENARMRSWHKLVGNGGKVCPEAEYRREAMGLEHSPM